jgi:competence protein ComEA
VEEQDRSWLSVPAINEGAKGGSLVDRLHQRPAVAIALAIGACLAAAVAGIALTATAATPSIDIGGIAVSGAAPAPGGPGLGGALVVDVAGAVRRPGVYRLAPDSRVGDAIEAAGGYSGAVDAAAVAHDLNLAAPLSDGQKLVVPVRGSANGASTGPGAGGGSGSSGDGASGGAGALVDLNHASQSELEALPGIGPVTARKIIDARSERPFATPHELLDRKLVGESTWEKLRDLVTAG